MRFVARANIPSTVSRFGEASSCVVVERVFRPFHLQFLTGKKRRTAKICECVGVTFFWRPKSGGATAVSPQASGANAPSPSSWSVFSPTYSCCRYPVLQDKNAKGQMPNLGLSRHYIRPCFKSPIGNPPAVPGRLTEFDL